MRDAFNELVSSVDRDLESKIKERYNFDYKAQFYKDVIFPKTKAALKKGHVKLASDPYATYAK